MTGKYPRLRSHSRKRKSGKVVTYYFYDMRPDGEPDVPLGADFDEAVRRWDDLHNKTPKSIGTLEEAFKGWEKEVLPTYTKKNTLDGYKKNLRTIRPIFGPATWDQVDLPTIKGYLKKRTAKTQANREMALLSIIWNWARGEGMTKLHWPAAGMEKSKWRNKEKPRKVKVDYDIFTPIYAEGDQILRDCMDLASATGMRLEDCISILLPRGDVLRLDASKTGKEADIDLSLSQVLPELLARRRKVEADHLMLLSTTDGKPVTLTMLRYRWDKARFLASRQIYADAGLLVDFTEAQAEAYELARRIRALYLRDMRKMAAQLSPDLKSASALLQHPNEAFTQKHYGGVTKLVTVR